ncbi:MAG: hypothetical protein IJO13_00415 [Lachnospiraceae bacterium]|nr:hypothetical protein [Lachnospiraceae bacterium]
MKKTLANISVDIEINEQGEYDVWISTEGSSGAHYVGLTPDQIGKNVADLIECLREASE